MQPPILRSAPPRQAKEALNSAWESRVSEVEATAAAKEECVRQALEAKMAGITARLADLTAREQRREKRRE